jgi:uncharacterized protein involved in exopolysaccharide biosynthesis
MDLNETGRRIFIRHWRTILMFVVAGLAVSYLLSSARSASYTASTRLALNMPDPRTQAESQVIADTGNALSSSPGQVARALASAHIKGRNAADIAQNDVSTTSLGTSGVLELSVTDRDPRIAAKIANALAPEIIRERANLTSGATQRTLSTLDERIAHLNLQVGRLDARLEALNQQVATTNSGVANPLRVQRDQTSATRDTLAAQANALQTERDNIASVNAVQPQGGVISAAATPTQANSTGRATKLVLGFLLGLVLGVGTAALIATLRPMLVGGYTLAEELGLPLLRQLSTAPDEPARPAEVGPLAERLRLAAETAHVRRVCLVGAGSGVDVGPLAELLDEAVQARPDGAPEPGGGLSGSAGRTLIFVGARREPREAVRRHASDGPEVEPSGLAHPRIRVMPADFRGSPVANGGGTALALVSAAALSKAELADATQLLRVSPVATLGLISYGRASRRHRGLPNIFAKA